jgi:pectinesterase
LDEIESTFAVTGAKEVTIGIGLNKAPADRDQDAEVVLGKSAADGSLTQWVVQKTNGQLGTAVIVPGGNAGFAEDEGNSLVLAKVKAGRTLRYYAGAGWSRAGEFKTAQQWNDYVAACAARANSPVKVTLVTEP